MSEIIYIPDNYHHLAKSIVPKGNKNVPAKKQAIKSNLLPIFPRFKPLELSDKHTIEKFTHKFPPYSDFNFVSLYGWDTKNAAQIAELNGNLVLKFFDYLTGEPFFSFIGANNLEKTALVLLDHAEKQDVRNQLELIPEHVVQSLSSSNYLEISEDINNHDYVLSVENLVSMQGKKLGPKRNFINRFKRKYEDVAHTELLDLSNPKIVKQIKKLFTGWEKNRGLDRENTKQELEAVSKLLTVAGKLDIHSLGIFDKDELIGFSINEITHNEHGVIHYEKADISYIGIFAYLKQQSAQKFKELGCKFINYQQDLGIEGLRKSKNSYQPTNLLKKYKISKLS